MKQSVFFSAVKLQSISFLIDYLKLISQGLIRMQC